MITLYKYLHESLLDDEDANFDLDEELVEKDEEVQDLVEETKIEE